MHKEKLISVSEA